MALCISCQKVPAIKKDILCTECLAIEKEKERKPLLVHSKPEPAKVHDPLSAIRIYEGFCE